MEEIAHNVFIENRFRGVVLGAIKVDQGLILIDAPFLHDDIQAWRKTTTALGDDLPNKLLVMLDTHIDRLLGVRAFEMDVLGHQSAIDILTNRTTTIRTQDIDCGAAYTPDELSTTIHWPVPNLSYSDQVRLYWDDEPLLITHQPGVHAAGSWLDFRSQKIVFVGDSVVLHQPPFLAWADLDVWIAELTWLVSDVYKGYKVVSGRSGVVTKRSIDWMLRFLMTVKEVVVDLAHSENRSEGIAAAVPLLLRRMRFDKVYADFYKNRLMWGLDHYLQKHYPKEHHS